MTAEQRAQDVEAIDAIPEVNLPGRQVVALADLIAAARREGAAQGWDEGANAEYLYSRGDLEELPLNPYRADAIARGDRPTPTDRQLAPGVGDRGDQPTSFEERHGYPPCTECEFTHERGHVIGCSAVQRSVDSWGDQPQGEGDNSKPVETVFGPRYSGFQGPL